MEGSATRSNTELLARIATTAGVAGSSVLDDPERSLVPV
jgi:hypothetical protein